MTVYGPQSYTSLGTTASKRQSHIAFMRHSDHPAKETLIGSIVTRVTYLWPALRPILLVSLLSLLFAASTAIPVDAQAPKNLTIETKALNSLTFSKEIPAPSTPLNQNLIERLVNDDTSFDVTYYRFRLDITPDTEYVAGSVLVRSIVAKSPSTDSITLSLKEQLQVDSIFDGQSNRLSFTHKGNVLGIDLKAALAKGQLFDVTVHYHGYNTEPNSFGYIHTTHNLDGVGPEVVWSHSEPYWSRNWWPCKDNNADKADSADLYFRCDTEFVVSSVGSLKQVIEEGRTHIYHWKVSYPIDHYLIALACTNYAIDPYYWKHSPTDSLLIVNYAYPENLEKFVATHDTIIMILDYFSKLFGPYPFLKEKYGLTEWRGGGMEHQTNSFVNNTELDLLAHETAHQWWGDNVTCRTWNDIWLNEGVTTFATHLFARNLFGDDVYQQRMGDAEKYITEIKTESVYVPDDTLHDVLRVFDGKITYEKGSFILHTLRYLLGDSALVQGMRNYQMGALRYGTAITEDFRSYLEAASGKDLTSYFDQWVYGEGFPIYTPTYSILKLGPGFRVTVRIEQQPSAPNGPLFTLPIELRFASAGKDTVVVANNTEKEQEFNFDLSFPPDTMEFDPHNWILDGHLPAKLFVKLQPQAVDGLRVYPTILHNGSTLSILMNDVLKPVLMNVLDERGVTVRSFTVKPSHTDAAYRFNTEGLPSGTYFISRSDHSSALAKFIILGH